MLMLSSSPAIAVDCGPLSDPSNGQVALNSTLRASDANYSCSDNYTLVGATRRVCQDDGSWSGEEPVCEGVCIMMG